MRHAAMLLLLLVQSASALPSIPQNWATHKRALLQTNLVPKEPPDDSDGNSTATPSTQLRDPYPIYDHATDYHAAPATTLEEILLPITTVSAESRTESILKLLLANLDHSDVKTMAMKLLPEYARYCSDALDCDELNASVRRLYYARYTELEQSLQRMDKLGYLLRRIQTMLKHTPANDLPPHHHHHNRRRPSDWHPHPTGLRRIDRNAYKRMPEEA